MANFKGHALPAVFFIMFGLWWCLKYSLKYHSRRLNKNRPGNRWFSRIEITEGAAKIICSVIGMLAEQFVPDGPHLYLYSGDPHTWVKLMNWQHTTMYLFFCISGIMDVLTYTSFHVPIGLDRLMLSVALFAEGFLFYFHVMNRPLLDQQIHCLLVFAIFGGAASVLLETFLRDQIVLELLRSSLALLQGTWLFQIGFVLFPPWGGPAWDVNDHGNLMFIIMCFCWHYALAIVILAMIYAVAYCVIQKYCTNKGGTEIKLGKRKENGKSSRIALLNGSDED